MGNARCNFDLIAAQRKAWDEMLDKQSDLGRSKDRIHPQAVARAVSGLAARHAVFVFDTGGPTGNWDKVQIAQL
jgi:pyruvate dehydrogenase (quinone)